jgi:hypothetical protein
VELINASTVTSEAEEGESEARGQPTFITEHVEVLAIAIQGWGGE